MNGALSNGISMEKKKNQQPDLDERMAFNARTASKSQPHTMKERCQLQRSCSSAAKSSKSQPKTYTPQPLFKQAAGPGKRQAEEKPTHDS